MTNPNVLQPLLVEAPIVKNLTVLFDGLTSSDLDLASDFPFAFQAYGALVFTANFTLVFDSVPSSYSASLLFLDSDDLELMRMDVEKFFEVSDVKVMFTLSSDSLWHLNATSQLDRIVILVEADEPGDVSLHLIGNAIRQAPLLKTALA